MADTATMDTVLAIITAIPHLHEQSQISQHVSEPWAGYVRTSLAEHPELPIPPEACGTAHCVAGWTLILKGYTFVPAGYGGVFFAPGPPTEPVDPIEAAAAELGLPRREAYDSQRGRGLFYDTNTVPQIRAWIAYYHGEIGQDELEECLDDNPVEFH